MLMIHRFIRFIFILIILPAVCRWSFAFKPPYPSMMALNKLKLNGGKTELLIIGSPFRPTFWLPLVVIDDGSMNLPSKYAINIGVTFDSVLNIAHHTTDICKSCYFNIRNIYRIRKFLSTDLTKIFVNAFVTSRLDNCNSLLHGLSRDVLHKVQLVQNCAARLFLGGYMTILRLYSGSFIGCLLNIILPLNYCSYLLKLSITCYISNL